MTSTAASTAASDAISDSTTDASSTAACAFERHVRRIHASGSHAKAPCVLDICPALGTHFAIGSLDLVQADLQAVCNSEVAATILDSLTAAGLTRTFGLRTEIVNFKKALLHVVGDVQKLERSMVRQASFFASESPRCKIEGHDCELCKKWRRARQRDLAFCQRPDGSDDGSPEDTYLRIIESIHRIKGLRMALVDLRSILKQLCLLPRHPDDAHRMPKPLLDLPRAFFAASAIARAEAEQLEGCRAQPLPDAPAGTILGTSTTASATDSQPGIGLLPDYFRNAVDMVMSELPPLAPHVLHYTRCSLVARGAAKALAQADGAAKVALALAQQQERTARVLELLPHSPRGHPSLAEPSTGCPNAACEGEPLSAAGYEAGSLAADDRALVTALSFEMKVGNKRRVLSALHAANEHLLATLRLVLDGREHPSAQRLFVASDSSRGQNAIWFPPPFAGIIQMAKEGKEAYDRFEVQMNAAIAAEGCPLAELLRTRLTLLDGGSLTCRVCGLQYPKLWLDRGVCWRCDDDERLAGRCPYEAVPAKGKSKAHPFCPHEQLRCACCDAGFQRCDICRLAQGDGEAVLAACATWHPDVLFLDFDQTLCSTRSGADPLKGVHSVDAELHEAATKISTHVLTRNRHVVPIRSFLEERGVPIVGIHSTPSGDSKASYMQSILTQDARAIFVDDDANEVQDPEIARDTRIFRVLFQRT